MTKSEVITLDDSLHEISAKIAANKTEIELLQKQIIKLQQANIALRTEARQAIANKGI